MLEKRTLVYCILDTNYSKSVVLYQTYLPEQKIYPNQFFSYDIRKLSEKVLFQNLNSTIG